MSLQNHWVSKAKRLFAASFYAWVLATTLVVVRVISEVFFGEGFSFFYVQQVLAMFAALPGVLYFFLQSRKMSEKNLAGANVIFDKIMKFQKPTAILAFVGGGIGLLPFLVNLLGFLGLLVSGALTDLWANLDLMIPWASLYGFITFSVAALVLNRQRLKPIQ